MKTSLKRIFTEDSIELVGLLYEPENKTEKVLCFVHGMGGNFYENRFLDFIAEKLTENNIAFFVSNNRGAEFIKDLYKIIDNKREIVRIGDAYEKFEDSIYDIKAQIDFLEKEGFTEIHLGGHSLGCAKVAYYISETDDKRIKSIILASPSDMLGLVRNNKERFESDIKKALEIEKSGKGAEIMTPYLWDEYPISVSSYINMFSDDSKTGIFNFYDSKDQLSNLAKIKQSVFAVMGRKDDAMTVPIEEIMERLKKAFIDSTCVETNILGDADHGYVGFEEQLADCITKWLIKIIN
jgi:pimeloyl-ACP methyl ester carboxylesterase